MEFVIKSYEKKTKIFPFFLNRTHFECDNFLLMG
jgi:hypothetical protein